MGKVKDLDLQLAEDIGGLFRRFENGWLDAEMFGIDMLKEMKKFVDERAWMLNMNSPSNEPINKEK